MAHTIKIEEESLYRLLEGALEIILLFDKDGSILYANHAAKTDLGYEHFANVFITDIFRKVMCRKEGAVAVFDLEAQKAIGKQASFETVAYRNNQTCFDIDLKITIEETEDGFFGMCNAINTTIRAGAIKDMVKAKEKVEDATKVRNEFVSNVTHELRTPVNGILGISKNLLETTLDAQQLESIHIIHVCCNNMIQIINNLLDFSKLEAGKFTIEEREFSFREMLEKTISMNINQVNEKGLRLLLNVSTEIPDRMIGDELRISQILSNLISNAVKFTSVGQIVIDVVKTMEINHTIELFFMVIDTGIGIAKNDMDKLFKSFSQVDASITRRFGGTGLGLTIVKELVELMEGEIQVESEKGKGSTFSFSLRLKTAQGDTVENSKAYASGKFVYDGNTRREILEVDEEAYDVDQLYQFGTIENLKELNTTMDKLILCIEMENWEKAEHFSGVVKKLVSDDSDLKRKAFRLEMTVRKSDYEQALLFYNEFKEMLEKVLESKTAQ